MSINKSISTLTLGCKVNQYETEAMIKLFTDRGYKISDKDSSDIYLINTCTVTSLSDKKSRQYIRRAKKVNPDAIIVVAGCYSQVSPEEVSKIPEVDIVIGTSDKDKIVELCDEFLIEREKINTVKDIMKVNEFEELGFEGINEKTRAFLKVQDGCNQYCSYCIIPYARGKIRSRDIKNITKELKTLASRGYKEVVLTGIHVASYGKDLKEDISLIDVIEKSSSIEGIERLRLSSIEPNVITDDFLDRYSKVTKACNHFHLSLQSGSTSVLKRMNRRYTAEEYFESVEKLKSKIDGVALTTDIIVGFPGETDKEFEETYEFVKKVGFSRIHVFQYSPRKGTPAASHSEQIDGSTKAERSKKLIELGKRLTKEYNNEFIGRELDVLFEEENSTDDEYIEGYTTNYIRVAVKGNIEELENEIKKVKIESAKEKYLIGSII